MKNTPYIYCLIYFFNQSFKTEKESSNSTLGDEVMALSNLIIESEVDETVFEYDASLEENLLDDLGFL